MNLADFPIIAGGITIYAAAIPSGIPRHRRREAETSAVDSLVASSFGPEARLMHRHDGSPYIEGSEYHISVSHCATAALLAASPHKPAGIDIEQYRPQLLRVATKFLSDAERNLCDTPQKLLMAWTAKEATFKAAGIEGAVISEIAYPYKGDFSRAALRGNTFAIDFFGAYPTHIALAYPV